MIILDSCGKDILKPKDYGHWVPYQTMVARFILEAMMNPI